MANLQWKVYIARVGSVESDIAKFRPVLVLNEPVGSHKIVLVAPIFSAKYEHNLVGDVKVADGYTDLGLVKPSTIRLHRMVSLPAAVLLEQLNEISLELQADIHTELKKLFRF